MLKMYILESLLKLANQSLMNNIISISRTIRTFNKTIQIEGDKSLSIRWALLASQAIGKSSAINILKSDDVLNTLKCLRKLGVKVKLSKNKCIINGVGLNGYKYKKKIILDAGNSGTLGRLIIGLLIHSKNKIKIIGDKSLSKRDFNRISEPLKKFGADIKLTNKGLPLTIKGNKNPLPINYLEKKGSAQVKSSIILAGLKTEGKTFIKSKPSRNHTELLCKYLKLP